MWWGLVRGRFAGILYGRATAPAQAGKHLSEANTRVLGERRAQRVGDIDEEEVERVQLMEQSWVWRPLWLPSNEPARRGEGSCSRRLLKTSSQGVFSYAQIVSGSGSSAVTPRADAARADAARADAVCRRAAMPAKRVDGRKLDVPLVWAAKLLEGGADANVGGGRRRQLRQLLGAQLFDLGTHLIHLDHLCREPALARGGVRAQGGARRRAVVPMRACC